MNKLNNIMIKVFKILLNIKNKRLKQLKYNKKKFNKK